MHSPYVIAFNALVDRPHVEPEPRTKRLRPRAAAILGRRRRDQNLQPGSIPVRSSVPVK